MGTSNTNQVAKGWLLAVRSLRALARGGGGARGWSPQGLAGRPRLSCVALYTLFTYLLERPLLHLFEGPSAYSVVLL